MLLKYFLTNLYEQLQDVIGDNLSKYTSATPWIESVLGDNFDAEAPVQVSLPALIVSTDPSCDFENVKLLYPALQHLTPEQATDGRLWAHLSHIEYWKYMRARWPIGNDDLVKDESGNSDDKKQKLVTRIRERYFLHSDGNDPVGNSRFLIRNGISRLWWFGYLTFDRHAKDPFALTKTLLEYQDTQAALLERTFGKNPEVLKVCLKVLAENMPSIRQNGGRAVIQGLGKYINLLGGTYLLDTMDKTVLKEKVTAFVRRKLQE